jgi:hypothetical protein
MADAKTTIKNAGKQVAETAKQLSDQARETASNVAERSKDAINALSHSASNAAAYLEDQGENAADTVSGGLKATARTIRQNAPQDGPLKDAALGTAQQFSNAAQYLDEQGLEGLASDISCLIKKSPVAALAAGIGLGFLLGLTLRSRA